MHMVAEKVVMTPISCSLSIHSMVPLYPADLAQIPIVVNYVLGGGGLSGIDVGHDTDVSEYVKVYFRLFGQGFILLVQYFGLAYFHG